MLSLSYCYHKCSKDQQNVKNILIKWKLLNAIIKFIVISIFTYKIITTLKIPKD